MAATEAELADTIPASACVCGAGWDEIENQRRWEELDLVIGECERCGSTVSRPWVPVNGEES